MKSRRIHLFLSLLIYLSDEASKKQVRFRRVKTHGRICSAKSTVRGILCHVLQLRLKIKARDWSSWIVVHFEGCARCVWLTREGHVLETLAFFRWLRFRQGVKHLAFSLLFDLLPGRTHREREIERERERERERKREREIERD